MKAIKRVAALALAAAMALSLAACDSIGGTSEEERMQAFVQGKLDMLYKGQYNKDYLEEMEMTEEEAASYHNDFCLGEAYFFENYIGSVDVPTEETDQEIADLYKEIYSHCKYTVGKGNKLESGNFAVEVTFEPLDIMTKFTPDDFQLVFEDVLTAHNILDYDTLQALSDEEYAALDAEYTGKVLDMIRAELPNIGYGEEKSVTVQIKDTADYYEPVQDDFDRIDNAIIDYSNFGY